MQLEAAGAAKPEEAEPGWAETRAAEGPEEAEMAPKKGWRTAPELLVISLYIQCVCIHICICVYIYIYICILSFLRPFEKEQTDRF